MNIIKAHLLDFKITDIINETKEAKTFLIRELNNRITTFLPGQFLTLNVEFENHQYKRTYSISTSPYELPIIGITIKKNKNGFISDYLMENLKPGDSLNCYPPSGHFTLIPESWNAKQLILIAAGSGMTPLMSILKSVLFAKQDFRLILIYGNRNEDSIIFDKVLNTLEYHHNNFKMIHILSQPSESWQGIKGRITPSLVREIIISENISSEAEYYISGPGKMTEEIADDLANFNVPVENIHKEYFSISIFEDAELNEKDLIPREVTIIINHEEHKIVVDPGNSILETALNAGLDIPNSCNIGECGTCMAKLVSGKINLVEQTALTPKEISEGYCLTCVGSPQSDDVIIDYDATSKW